MKKLTLFLLLLMVAGLLLSETVELNNGMNSVRLVSSDNNSTVLALSVSDFERNSVRINNEEFDLINMSTEPVSQESGAPMLPVMNRSIIIPATANADVKILKSEYQEFDMNVAPSKGSITRNIDPATVAYTFGAMYNENAYYPQELVTLSEPYILRDMRGVVVKFSPFTFNPVTKKLRVYTRLLVEVENNGFSMVNTLDREATTYSKEFLSIYENHFMNFTTDRYTPVEDSGSLLAIAPTQYMDLMQEYVDWKIQKGMNAELVELSTIGTTASQIQTFIQNYYNSNPNLAFVQLAGDAAQMPALSHYYSGQNGGADPILALVNGTDSYPDIFIGRFSAENTSQLETQVDRVIWYERDIDNTNDWLNNAIGIASDEGGGSNGDMGESDIVHMNNIRTDLLGYGYNTVDQIYDPGASSSNVANSVNAGRGFINYVGHGSTTAWSTTGFSVNNCNQLTNDYKLPFIVSVACVNGNFVSNTCFAEGWTRATNGDAPTGAMAIYASSVNQDWDSPMRGQDEITDLLIAEDKTTVGGLYYNGSCEMMDNYAGVGTDMYKTWNIFGDASLMVRTRQPEDITVSHMPTFFLGSSVFNASVSGLDTGNPALVSITDNGTLLGAGYTDASGNAAVTLDPAPLQPTNLTVTVTAFNKVTYTADVLTVAADGAYIIVNDLSFTNASDGQYGNTADVNITLENVGVDASGVLTVNIASADPYVTITQPEITTAALDADGQIMLNEAFTVSISDSVPDQYMIPVTVTIIDPANNWTAEKSLTVNAPALSVEALTWTEILGNGNSMYDQGEIWNVQFIATNNGHASAGNGFTTLSFDNTLVSIVPAESPIFTRLGMGSTAIGNYNVAFSSQIPALTSINLDYGVESGNYMTEASDNVIVGLTMETFDNNFDSYGYTFTGGNWTIDANGGHDGVAAKTADISNNGTTTMQVTMTIAQAGQISFWKKVSSESSYDFFRFYIDNQEQGEWSGSVNWSQETYDVSAGNHTFKWEYSKDWMASSGSDCAWVDDIVFPMAPQNPGAPIFAIDTTAIEFGEVMVGEESAQTVTLTNSGDEVMVGAITSLLPEFKIRRDGTDADEISYIVESGDTFDFDIVFMPTATENYSQQVAVTSDDPNNPLSGVIVNGVGTPTDNNDNVAVYTTTLQGNYPNPFNPETNIAFSMKESGKVKIEVYNILGKKVTTVLNDVMTKGNHSVLWKGDDSNGKQVASGIYFYRMTTDSYKATNKMILMK